MMGAVEFLEKRNRMCGALGDECTDKDGTLCPLLVAARKVGKGCYGYTKSHPAEAVEIVERWAKEHPRKTRQSELLKLFPRASMTADGIIAFCPDSMDSEFECPRKTRDNIDPICGECRRKYWLEEVDEDD
nr:MAG TPA: hypothetical protein [Caudoviricetes sp.]